MRSCQMSRQPAPATLPAPRQHVDWMKYTVPRSTRLTAYEAADIARYRWPCSTKVDSGAPRCGCDQHHADPALRAMPVRGPVVSSLPSKSSSESARWVATHRQKCSTAAAERRDPACVLRLEARASCDRVETATAPARRKRLIHEAFLAGIRLFCGRWNLRRACRLGTGELSDVRTFQSDDFC